MTGRYEPEPTTVEEVRDYRDLTGASMWEANEHLRKEKLTDSLEFLRELGTLEEKVEFLLDRYAETLK